MNVGSMLLPGPEVILPLELEPFATTLVYRSGIGIRQKVAFSLRRLRLALFDREHEGSENQGPQNSGCKPRSIAIETSDYVACHWNTSLCLGLLARGTWFLHSGNTLRKWVGAHIKLLVTPIWLL